MRVEGNIGIDVSVWQGDIDWRAVASSEVKWTYIKATEGNRVVDGRWSKNRNEAEKVGLPWGGYHFARPNGDLNDARQEAQQLIDAGGDSGPLPGVLDMETTLLDFRGTVDWCKAFLEMLVNHSGRFPWIYSGAYFLGNPIADEPELIEYPWILPAYRASGIINPDPFNIPQPGLNGATKYCQVWQYTSEGRVPGIQGNVDKNITMNGFTVENGLGISLIGPYMVGSFGSDVSLIQTIVGVQPTGTFDETTKDAVIQWQRRIGVQDDGVWGISTAKRTSEIFRYISTVKEEQDVVVIIVDGREGRLSGWLLDGLTKLYIERQEYLELLQAAAGRGEGDLKNVGLRSHGDPYIARLDLARLVNPEVTPVALGGTKES